MSLIVLVFGGLVTWRLSVMLAKENGPLGIFARARSYFASKQKRIGGIYDAISCVSCLSIYMGSLAAIWPARSVFEWIAYALSFSAIAVLTERSIG